ncbi:phosphate ABC transporter membrane protein 2, PhoT family (TC 3.A.1.7.1) [Lentzea albidocapillata subsp. violacea]|uniref:Phosphate transport system permease protein PstA n=1 Tax=Lentzea albidocapillata subsp. violacea TaxID=128104 RepID=A0A1G9YD62_9PSEU|nr:phosphate ABC transporter permease PstA [Lentzea albidocapillata]SDN07092.1 phosphate ABC transporter membrane protein 2, PhoT family (TC 3.A.1.7.1) [Lentzea albidocapillata subsp. violacea]
MTATTLVVDQSLKSGRRKGVGPTVFAVALWACLAIICAFLFFVLAVIIQKGLARFDLNLVTEHPSRLRPDTSGVKSALFGTIWIMVLTALIALPLGIAAAVYLEEYADNTRWWNRLIELNIQNLAAVPSVIYGILTLGFVVRGPLSIGAVLLAGAISLALLILPVVIITCREALRAVPSEIRSGSLALGATQWQTTWRQVLPSAVPGIATGSILALSRAIGEAAPLLLVGATTFLTFNPDGVFSRYTVLPTQIFSLVPLDRVEFRDLAYSTILLLIIVLLVMNALAIWLRNRYQRRW